MRPQSLYYRVSCNYPAFANLSKVEEEVVPGTQERLFVFKAKTLNAFFNTESRTLRRWPRAFWGLFRWRDIVILDQTIADQIVAAGFTNIEFHPLNLRYGTLHRLEGTEHLAPDYVWARPTGHVLVDVFINGAEVQLDPTRLQIAQKIAGVPRLDLRIREHQPFAGGFNRVAPGGGGLTAISARVADFFDRLAAC